jgi:hypothetical protein
MTLDVVAYGQRVHARRRAKERKFLKLNRNERARVLADMRAGRAIYFGEQPNGRSVWAVLMGHLWAKAIYDPCTREIVTVMRLDHEERLQAAVFAEREGRAG